MSAIRLLVCIVAALLLSLNGDKCAALCSMIAIALVDAVVTAIREHSGGVQS